MIVGAQIKAKAEHALAIGWHTRNLHYIDKLKPLSDYLKPEPTQAEKREADAARVSAMFERMARKASEGEKSSP